MSSKPIHIYYHVCLINDGFLIASEQMHSLAMSGLMYNASSINIGIKYDAKSIIDYKDLFLKLIGNYNILGNINILYCKDNTSDKEREHSTIIHFKNYADSLPDGVNRYILYFHTKGVSHYKTHRENPVRHWRHYLEYFMIHHWRNCCSALDKEYESCGTYKRDMKFMNDCQGVKNVDNEKRLFYPGTFYWMNTSLIKKIPIKYFSSNSEYKNYAVEALPGLIEHKQMVFSQPNPYDLDMYNYVLHPMQYVHK